MERALATFGSYSGCSARLALLAGKADAGKLRSVYAKVQEDPQFKAAAARRGAYREKLDEIKALFESLQAEVLEPAAD
jgi:hypothetical protein